LNYQVLSTVCLYRQLYSTGEAILQPKLGFAFESGHLHLTSDSKKKSDLSLLFCHLHHFFDIGPLNLLLRGIDDLPSSFGLIVLRVNLAESIVFCTVCLDYLQFC
jgi:hypothetical protein